MEKIDIRLPRNVKPLSYHVKLVPFINGNFSIHGQMKMTFEVLDPTRNLTLHINDIITKNETIKITSQSDPDGMGVGIRAHRYDIDREFYIADLSEKLEVGQIYTIQMDFVGYLGKNMVGIYRSSYKDVEGNKRWLVATQFQSTHARKAFPCLDEPQLKANFSIELGRQEAMSSISNMPLRDTVPMEGNDGWFWDRFETTVKMSTYLVAFVISDFKYKEAPPQMDYKFRVWAREESVPQVDYAVKMGPSASKFFETYFDVPFPLPKQDMIALPDFSAGAMENWGLITYRETSLLFDPASSTARDKFWILSVIVHELAHQWFGNLVTPSWWTDLWLNEGFASYMEYVGGDAVEPSWKMMEQFAVNDLHRVFLLDCLESSHPINIAVSNPAEISEIFDQVSYLKGASIIRMMHHFLSEHSFRKGLSSYLKELAYESATQDDLWRYLDTQAHKDGTLPPEITVKTIMDTWTLQMGYPVVTVTNNKDGTATVTQERFLFVKNKSPKTTSEYKWWIPLTYSTKDNPDFSNTSTQMWMEPSETSKRINGMPTRGWIIFNNLQSSYYRVNYDTENWNLIIQQLLTDHKVINPINRAQIIDDAMNLARAGLLPYKNVFNILAYLTNEQDYVPWKAATRGLSFIAAQFKNTGSYGALREFLLSLVLPVYQQLGFTDDPNQPIVDQFLRSLILRMTCNLGYQPCLEESSKLFSKWRQNPDDYSMIAPNLKSTVYCSALENGGYEEWKFAFDRYLTSDVASEKSNLLGALGCSRLPWILNGYLETALESGTGVKKQDSMSVIISVSQSDTGRLVAWEFLQTQWNSLAKYLGSASSHLAKTLKYCTSSLNNQHHLAEFEQFQRDYKDTLKVIPRAVDQAKENILNNINWMTNHFEEIRGWLEQNNYREQI